MKRRWAAIGAALWLAGCSTLNPWSGDYACQGYPEGVNCKSAREVYELTNYRESVTEDKDQKGKGGGECQDCGEAGGVSLYASPAAVAVQGLGYAGPLPLRSRAQVMRIWVAPWESMDGALHMPTYLYAEVEERRWSIGEKKLEVAPHITPLESRALPAPPEKEAKKPAAAKKPPAQKSQSLDQVELTLPKENPRPAPKLDTEVKKSKNAPKSFFFDRQTGQPRLDN